MRLLSNLHVKGKPAVLPDHAIRRQSHYFIYRHRIYRVFNLKVDRQLSREYFTSDAIYNGSAGVTLYYYMCRSWQCCCRRGENQSWPSVSVDNDLWCLNNAIRFHNLVNSGRTCIYFGKLFKNDVLRPL
jgi:hypothetical protein